MDRLIGKYSFGVGDRFGRQGVAQLAAMVKARELGTTICPVWNKSYREHEIIGTDHRSVRTEADAAVKELSWREDYFVDADHIGLKNVESFLPSSDFFTLDVADFIGEPASLAAVNSFVSRHKDLLGELRIPEITDSLVLDEAAGRQVAEKYLHAIQQAGRLYHHIRDARGADDFVAEISMDETDEPQTPAEMLFILAAVADEKIPAQTIAPKFTGRFNKGVDYVGDVAPFEREFNEDLAVIAFAVQRFGLPSNLKLSVHSGSDKFAIYPAINRALKRFDAGLHVKTAGTTWLEELIGLAESGGDGLALAREVYRQAFEKREALCTPYATVIDIDPCRLPAPPEVQAWDGAHFAAVMRHDASCEAYNPDVRQLLHVGYKVAATMGQRYLGALEANRDIIAAGVTRNLFEKHIRPLFL